jgi:serine/threonine-protein kinase
MKREPARMSETFTKGSEAGPGNQAGQAPAQAPDDATTFDPVEGDPVEALVRQGEHPAAARLAVARGELTRAIGIYQRLWRYADALPLALELGDTGLAIELALDGGQEEQARRLAEGIPREDPAGLTRSAALFARRGAHHEAGQLAERAQDWKLAAEEYRRAGDHLEEGRMEEADGRLRQAGVAYELALEAAGDAQAAARAYEALGRLLGRLGQHRQAARALQQAARDPGLRLAAERALLAELVALGLPAAATALGARIHRTHPGHPKAPDAILALDRAERAARLFHPPQGPPQGPPQRPSPDATAEAGLVHRRFRVLRLLGAGATSQVFLAEDTLLGHEIALKLLVVGTHAAGAERLAYQRFAREAEAVGRLRHPNIVGLYDADASAGMFVMEYLPGGTLSERLARAAPLAPGVVRRLGLDLLSALTAAHDHGLVHRDVKPANILFDVAGNAKLADFGAAHLADFGQTQTGGLMGTVAYMSPEQITGSGIGPAADLYAAGVTLFEALTGRLPFPGPDIVGQHLGEPAPVPSRVRAAGGAGKLDARHDAVLLRALEKDPAQRFASAEEMAEALRGWPEIGPEIGLLDEPGALPPSLDPPVGPGPSDTARTDEVQVGRSANGGTLYRRRDPRLERTVLVERRTASLDEDPAALQRVRNLASAGGPLIQRVLGISPDGHAVAYEWIEGPRVAVEDLDPPWGTTMAQLAASLAADSTPDAAPHVDRFRPRSSGFAAITTAGPVLLVCEPRDGPGEP